MNDYCFVTRWFIDGTVEEVYDLLADPVELPRWWPSVYLSVEILEPGDVDGVGRLVDLHTKGWLPYTLKWQFRVIAVDRPNGYTLQASGDFVGRGEWTFVQKGDTVEATYDWRISAEKPLLRYLTPVLRPAFEANHRWAMAKGEESLRLELARRRAASAEIARSPGSSTTAGMNADGPPSR